MKSEPVGKFNRASIGGASEYADASLSRADCLVEEASASKGSQRFFLLLWRSGNVLLIFSLLAVVFCVAWEYSVRQYLRGFSDAIISPQGTPVQKIDAILAWMSNGPARLPAGPDPNVPDRDPTETLNYKALLLVCGTATNAFVNLADSSGLIARRLLLLDQNRHAKHVVAEVWIDSRWVVVDPTFRTIPRGPNGELLTRADLSDPAIFDAATKSIPHYNPAYTYDRTAHVRLTHMGIAGVFLRSVLNNAMPGWEDSETVSLLLERRSFAAAALSIFFLLFVFLARAVFCRIAEKRAGLRLPRIRDQFRRAARAFVQTGA